MRHLRLSSRLVGRFAGAEIDPLRAKAGRAALLGRAAEDIVAPRNFKRHKTGLDHPCAKLCFQQSAGNSARPQFNLLFRFGWNRLFHQNVGYLQAAVGL